MEIYHVCPRSSYPIYIASYYIKWLTISWTYNNPGIFVEYTGNKEQGVSLYARKHMESSIKLSTGQVFAYNGKKWVNWGIFLYARQYIQINVIK